MEYGIIIYLSSISSSFLVPSSSFILIIVFIVQPSQVRKTYITTQNIHDSVYDVTVMSLCAACREFLARWLARSLTAMKSTSSSSTTKLGNHAGTSTSIPALLHGPSPRMPLPRHHIHDELSLRPHRKAADPTDRREGLPWPFPRRASADRQM